jgi:RNA polymerase sigma-70 factor (ECF subfamily)
MSAIGQSLITILPRLRRYALALCHVADVADDLVQTACERALAAAGQYDGMRFEAWMFRIVRNAWYDRLRRQRTRGQESDITERDDIAALDAEKLPERRLLLRRVMAAIDALPEDQRDLMLLVCVEDVSYREAAEILDLPMGTVMSRLARARRKIADDVGVESGRLL